MEEGIIMALKCPLCKDAKILPIDKRNLTEHLIVTRDQENHYHVHGPINNKALIQDFVVFILKEAKIAYNIAPGPPPEKTAPKDNKKEG